MRSPGAEEQDVLVTRLGDAARQEVSHTGLSLPLPTDGCTAARKGSFNDGALETCWWPDPWAFDSRMEALQGQLRVEKEGPSSL